jgi:hypothetical protein
MIKLIRNKSRVRFNSDRDDVIIIDNLKHVDLLPSRLYEYHIKTTLATINELIKDYETLKTAINDRIDEKKNSSNVTSSKIPNLIKNLHSKLIDFNDSNNENFKSFVNKVDNDLFNSQQQQQQSDEFALNKRQKSNQYIEIFQTQSSPRDYLVWSICNTALFCCIGIIALFKSMQTRKANKLLNRPLAKRISKVTFWLNVSATLLFFLFFNITLISLKFKHPEKFRND